MSIILQEAGWMRTAYKLARRFGGKVVTAGRSKHPKIVGLDASGKQIKMTIPSSPSDNARTAKNVEAQLRRAGFIDQSKAAKVKDALVKGSKTTVLRSTLSRKSANQQTTFKDFTQKYQPNVQGPRKPNTPPRVKVQGPESELAHRHRTAFDKRLDAVIKDIRGTRAPMPTSVRSAPKPLTADEMEKLRKLNLTPKQRRKFRKMGLLPEGFYTEENKHRDDKLNYQYKDVTNPKKPVDPIKAIKLKKV